MTPIPDKRYPIGPYVEPKEISDIDTDHHINTIKEFYPRLKALVSELDDFQLDTPYREGGWTVRQLVNHLADCHMAKYLNFKMALTEENPQIRTFCQSSWAELQDSFSIDIKPALQIIKGLHKRWVYELKSLTNRELEMTFHDVEQNRDIPLRQGLSYCAWHCHHHLAHIQNLCIEKGW